MNCCADGRLSWSCRMAQVEVKDEQGTSVKSYARSDLELLSRTDEANDTSDAREKYAPILCCVCVLALFGALIRRARACA